VSSKHGKIGFGKKGKGIWEVLREEMGKGKKNGPKENRKNETRKEK
jgi:hypothetical protein